MGKTWKRVLIILGLIMACIGIGFGLIKFLESDVAKIYKKEILEYSKSDKNPKESSSENSKFQEGIKLLKASNTSTLKSIRTTDNEVYTLNFDGGIPNEIKILEKGVIFVLEPDERLPEGFAGTFQEIEDDNTVIAKIPQITDVFSDLEIDITNSNELEVVSFVANGRNIMARGVESEVAKGNKDDKEGKNSIEDAIKEGIIKVNEKIAYDDRGIPYVDKFGIILDGYKVDGKDFITLNGEISLEDLFFDLKIGIKDALLKKFNFNIYTDYTANIDVKIDANKKIEKDFEIGRLKLRTTGVQIKLGERKINPMIGIDIVFMVGTSGEIYLEGKIRITNEGYIEMENKIGKYNIDNSTTLYGKDYPHRILQDKTEDINDTKFKAEVGIAVKGGMNTAIKIPIKAEAYIFRMEICSATLSNGIEGNVEVRGDVKVESNKKLELKAGCELEANLDFISELEFDGSGIKELIEKINIEIENDFILEKKILKINLLNYKLPKDDDNKIDQESNDIEEDNRKPEGEEDKKESEVGKDLNLGKINWKNINIDTSKYNIVDQLSFDYNLDGTKDYVQLYSCFNMPESSYLVIVDGKSKSDILYIKELWSHLYASGFIECADLNSDNVMDIAMYTNGGGTGFAPINRLQVLVSNVKNGEYKHLDPDSSEDFVGIPINFNLVDGFMLESSVEGGQINKIKLDDKNKKKYIDLGLYAEDGSYLQVEDEEFKTIGRSIGFLDGGRIICKSDILWLDTAGVNPSNAMLGGSDIIAEISEVYRYKNGKFVAEETYVLDVGKDKYLTKYYKYTQN